jgi:hypothetical protein
MFNFLKKTWRQEEGTSQSSLSVPSAEDAESVLNRTLSQPGIDTSGWKSGSKRPREQFDPEPQPSSAERPSKATKIGTHDSIRNHLPEIVDSRHRDDTATLLSLSLLKEQISECAKQQNSESSLHVAIEQHDLNFVKLSQFFHQRNVRIILQAISFLPHFISASFQLLVEIISWSVDEECENRASLNPRTAIVVVE